MIPTRSWLHARLRVTNLKTPVRGLLRVRFILFALHLYKFPWDKCFPDAGVGSSPTPGITLMAEQGRCDACGNVTSWRNTSANMWICCLRCDTKVPQLQQRKLNRMIDDFVGGGR
jgi:hypothetical protein